MSPGPQISHAPSSIDTLLRKANAEILAGGADDRTRALAMEANQQAIELIEELIDNPGAFDGISAWEAEKEEQRWKSKNQTSPK